jgi:hypothetical protein
VTPIYRRRQLEKVGGYRLGLDCAQEFDLHIRLALVGYSFKCLPEYLVMVRRRKSSISSDSQKVLKQVLMLLRELLVVLHQQGELTCKRRVAIAERVATLGRAFARVGDMSNAKIFLAEARSIDEHGVRKAYGTGAWALNSIFGLRAERLVALKRRICDWSGRPI